jgi:hypothetical protein
MILTVKQNIPHRGTGRCANQVGEAGNHYIRRLPCHAEHQTLPVQSSRMRKAYGIQEKALAVTHRLGRLMR